MAELDLDITKLQTDFVALKGAVDGAVVTLNGVAGKIAAAVAAAQAAGATPAQLQALIDLDTEVQAEAAALSAANITASAA